jgi:hypothetical protein
VPESAPSSRVTGTVVGAFLGAILVYLGAVFSDLPIEAAWCGSVGFVGGSLSTLLGDFLSARRGGSQ